jgi:hypothetical protein
LRNPKPFVGNRPLPVKSLGGGDEFVGNLPPAASGGGGPASAGKGFVDGNGTVAPLGFTSVDLAYPALADFLVNTIRVNIFLALDSIQIGCGTISGTTFTKRNNVLINAIGAGAGYVTFVAPTDFTAFQMLAGDHIAFYGLKAGCGTCGVDTTTTPVPKGIGLYSGNGWLPPSFIFAPDATRTPEVLFEGLTT